jgi:hypothetical protein
MLAMTCKREWEVSSEPDKTILLLSLAYEGDERGLLKSLLSSPVFLKQKHKYPLRSVRLPQTIGPFGYDLHKLLHAAIKGGQLELVQWFYNCVLFDDKSCFDRCIHLAVQTGNHELVWCVTQQVIKDEKESYGVTLEGDIIPGDDGATRCLVTEEAIRANNVPLLQYLQDVGLLEPDTNFFVNARPIPNEDRFAPAIEWMDAFRFILPLRRMNVRDIVNALCCSLIAQGWEMIDILTFLKCEIPNGHIPNFWTLRWIFSCGLRYKHREAIDWAWPQCVPFFNQNRYFLGFCLKSIKKFASKETARRLLSPENLRDVLLDAYDRKRIQKRIA